MRYVDVEKQVLGHTVGKHGAGSVTPHCQPWNPCGSTTLHALFLRDIIYLGPRLSEKCFQEGISVLMKYTILRPFLAGCRKCLEASGAVEQSAGRGALQQYLLFAA